MSTPRRTRSTKALKKTQEGPETLRVQLHTSVSPRPKEVDGFDFTENVPLVSGALVERAFTLEMPKEAASYISEEVLAHVISWKDGTGGIPMVKAINGIHHRVAIAVHAYGQLRDVGCCLSCANGKGPFSCCVVPVGSPNVKVPRRGSCSNCIWAGLSDCSLRQLNTLVKSSPSKRSLLEAVSESESESVGNPSKHPRAKANSPTTPVRNVAVSRPFVPAFDRLDVSNASPDLTRKSSPLRYEASSSSRLPARPCKASFPALE
ncbi:hypothetical protein AJ80_10055 [Polytolypa hystricis UAMH7299]|uniref:Uncharacterized protein n=1 Tax=Polytolypa hystricis (strain UAMH7299) TaxID=1447883 RepID=A0A2B7WEH4_POLH7|nr:hypothetical protein AJ80_10055 [Polytolypa hystricis UAMH7299]